MVIGVICFRQQYTMPAVHYVTMPTVHYVKRKLLKQHGLECGITNGHTTKPHGNALLQHGARRTIASWDERKGDTISASGKNSKQKHRGPPQNNGDISNNKKTNATEANISGSN